MKQDWVKAIGKKLREDLGDCPPLPQELVDALERLDQSDHARRVEGVTSGSKPIATTKREKQDRAIQGAGSYDFR